MPSNEEVVRELWGAVDRRDWVAVESLCDERCTFTLPQSGEKYGREGFLRVNREYPGDWHIFVNHIIGGGDWVVSEVMTTFPGKVDQGVTLFRLDQGKIMEIREYWPEPFPVPDWRAIWMEQK